MTPLCPLDSHEHEKVVCIKDLQFDPFSRQDIPVLTKIFDASAGYRSCDLTLGGMFMWIDWFGYRRIITEDKALLVTGMSESDITTPAFSMPVGGCLADNLAMLKDYCRKHGHRPLRFSAVPEGGADALSSLGATNVKELPDWADYIYDAEALATLRGKHLNKKRNHVNRFKAENPDYVLLPITQTDEIKAETFLASLTLAADKPPIAEYELMQTRKLLTHIHDFGMEGAMLCTPKDGIVALTVGELRGDTLHLHVEKARHDVSGAGEAINNFFAAAMLEKYPQIRYINRQDDSGDPGLRKAKLSYHPAFLIKKYEIIF